MYVCLVRMHMNQSHITVLGRPVAWHYIGVVGRIFKPPFEKLWYRG